MTAVIRTRRAPSVPSSAKRSRKKMRTTISSTLVRRGSNRMRMTNAATTVLKTNSDVFSSTHAVSTVKTAARMTASTVCEAIFPSSSCRSISRSRRSVCARKNR
ncbi:hypothetical protein COSO111634_27705 [Corallococcus soli]